MTPAQTGEGEPHLIFEGNPAEMALGMLGRRSAAPLLKKSSPAALQQYQKLWISL